MATADLYLRAQNMRTWLEHEAAQTGDERDRERYADGKLSESELRMLARRTLFAPLNDARLRRWIPMPWSAVNHGPAGCVGRVAFEKHEVTGPVTLIRELARSAERHEWLQRTGERFKIVIYQHVGTCCACGAQASALSVHVSIAWAGRSLAREFTI